MCRLLVVKSDSPFLIRPHLEAFASLCRNSREYQGHGWGLAFIKNSHWTIHRSVRPIWEEDLSIFGSTGFLMVHARSAFRNKCIGVEHNMPFCSRRHVFIFNGELRGVRIPSEGKIGAEKLFHFIKRFDRGDLFEAMKKSVSVIQKRSDHIRGMNFIIGDGQKIYLNSLFTEDEDYFTMHTKRVNGTLMICSEPYPGQADWRKINNQTIRILE
ncbi:MAG: hypothetical protein JXB26_00370 [Candidatus Aminicenantes bacterium]|nr:hypothetical protein [Candidatus Aminicenantes bacterium]